MAKQPQMYEYIVHMKNRRGDGALVKATVIAGYATVNGNGDLTFRQSAGNLNIVAAFHSGSWEWLERIEIKENPNGN